MKKTYRMRGNILSVKRKDLQRHGRRGALVALRRGRHI